MAITSITNRKIGPLKVIEVGEAKNGPTIVLFHGYGASGSDLAPVSAETPLDFPAHWVFPDAPNRTHLGGLAWFHIDEQAIEKAQQNGIADPILGFPGALKLFDLLNHAGLKGEFFKFEGGHTISLEVLEAFGAWIGNLR